MSSDTHAILTILSIVISAGTIVVGILRGREMVARSALEAVGSLEGRRVVMAITDEKHDRVAQQLSSIEGKLDALTTSVNGMAIKVAVLESGK